MYRILRNQRRLRLFENRLLRGVFQPRREEMAGGWIRVTNEELRNLYATPNIIRVIKAGRMRWAEHIGLMGEKEMHTNVDQRT
jgi:hypothetical protein